MADKRELLLVVRGKDMGAKDVLDDLAEGAEDAEDELDDLNRGLKKLDGQMAASTQRVEALRREIAKSGDLGLIKDLEKAQRELNRLTRQRKLLIPIEPDVDRFSGTVGAKLLKGFSKFPRIFGGIGNDSADDFSIGFVGRVGPLLARAPLSPPIAAAIAAGAPLISSAVAGAVTVGLSGAVVGGGLLVAAKDARVQAAAKTLGNEVNNSLGASIREAFVPEALKALSHVRAEFNKIEPDLERIFSKSARFVEPLTRAGTGFAEAVLPGIEKAIDRADPLFAVLEQRIPRIGAAISGIFDDLSQSADESADAIAGLLTLTEGSLITAGKAIGFIAENAALLGLGPLMAIGDAVGDNDEATQDWANTFNSLVTSAQGAETAVKSFAETANETINANLSAAEANLRYKESLDAVKDASNKKNTVSREEDQALLALARSSNALTESLDAQGRGALEAAAHNARLRRDFINAAIAAGYAEDAAGDLADKYLAIPANVNTKIQADTKQAERNLKYITDLIARIKSKKVVITTQHKQIVTRVGGRNVPIGDLGGVAHGGYIDGPGPKGVDSVPKILAPGEFVINADAVDRIGRRTLEALNAGRPVPVSSRPSAPAGGAAISTAAIEAAARAGARAAGRELIAALAGSTLRIDDRTARFADLLVRGG